MSPSINPSRDTHLLYRDLHGRSPEIVVGAKGSYLTLDDGTQILDACAGAAVASIGHGDERVINAVTEQMRSLSYHHTSRLTNPAAEELASILLPTPTPTPSANPLTHAIFLSSGSEANESALKLVRQYFVEIGQPQRHAIISRENSYHGNTIGCVSLTGIPSRRKHFGPYLLPTYTRVSPCYPYRYKLTDSDGVIETDSAYSARLAFELETEILRIGSDKVCAFFAETVGGAAAGNLTPVPGYFRAIREICDKYGVLLVLDEIMCGMGRTGKLHAWEWEGVTPDVQTIGKGLNGGYMPLSAVLISDKVVQGLKSGSGAFANGQTFQCHPAAAAAGIAVMKVFESDRVVENCAKRGRELFDQLTEAVGSHPNVGDIRGRGLFLSLEFVKDKITKSTFPVTLPLASILDDAIFRWGVSIYSGFGKGTADGIVGDHILFSPPLTITSEEVKVIVKATKEAVEEVFASERVQRAMEG